MTQHLPILAIITLFIGAFIVALIKEKNEVLRNTVVLIATFMSFIFTLMMYKPIIGEGNIITYWMGNWEPVQNWAIGIGLEVDQLSLFFGLFISLSIVLSALYSFKYIEKETGKDKYYVLFLMMSASVMGFIFTGDLFNMYVMIEIMTFASVALTAFRNNKPEAVEAGFKYIAIGSIGSSLILLATVIIYAQFHTLNLAQIAGELHNNYTITTLFALALMVVGYAVKVFAVPTHFVAPDAYMTAPSSISMLFSGIVNKAAVYGILRVLYVVYQSMNLPSVQFMLIFWGTVTMFIGVTMALAQHDFKRLLAFHSISQIGYVITGIGLATALGITGGLYHALNHTLFKGLLFLCAGAVYYATGTTDLDKLGGLAKRMPQTALIFIIGAFSISGIPPFNGFVSKWIIYQASYEAGYAPVTIIALIVSVMTLASFIKVAQSAFFGQLPKEFKNVEEVPLSMRVPMWIMAILCIVGGIFPSSFTKYLITPAANAVMNSAKYVEVMMGPEFASKFYNNLGNAPVIDYKLAGYWQPIAWLILFGILLLAFTLVALLGGFNPKHFSYSDEEDAKYDVFYSGESAEFSHVGGSDLFWGLKYQFRHYFDFMHKIHNGVVNDYALSVVLTAAVVLLYVFTFVR
ncbi:proton-conducting transporter transmembrane domain-containing protein [Thermobrachium celere]|uniref:proton-conducting transporter transmembrane domain-containing protein n=1 Tax=Thermobrachium celere TaxID=53422 RepID=UPI001944DC35|nr:proton-conducting transporter membrane subunit [Thermobrachium celere]GFR36342.1 cation:proton antiporter [Thermobrachium celere]